MTTWVKTYVTNGWTLMSLATIAVVTVITLVALHFEDVMDTTNIGNPISARFIDGGALGEDKTEIAFAHHHLVVYGAMQINLNDDYLLTTKRNHSRHLCEKAYLNCKKLIE